MSMLYLWHPAVSETGLELDLILTRGDSDQIGGGADRFVAAVLGALEIATPPVKWSIKPHRCNFYSEYWREDGWQSRWDYVWRMTVHFKTEVALEPLKLGYLGIDDIDDYSPLVESYKYEPFACLAVAVFASEEKAQGAALRMTDDREIEAERQAAGAPPPVLQVVRVATREDHLRAAIGSGGEEFFTGDYPAMVVSMLEKSGGITHAES